MRKAAVLALFAVIAPELGAAVVPPRTLDGFGLTGPVGLRSEPAISQSAQATATRGEWTADTRNTWRDNDNEPRIQFNLRTSAGDSRWGFGVRMRDLAGLPPAAFSSIANDVQFSWTREAGTFRFNGSFDDGRGSGTFTFTPDQAFVNNMAGAGYKNLDADDVVRLAMIDVTIAHVRGLAQAGYSKLSLDDVVRTRIHRVTPEFVRDLAGVGYKNVDIESLIRMAIHGATPANIKAMQDAGIRGQSVEDVIKFRIHKVTPDYIRSMREVGFTSLSEDQLVKMRIHKVDALFIRHAREDGFSIQTPGDAVDLAIHGPWRKRRG